MLLFADDLCSAGTRFSLTEALRGITECIIGRSKTRLLGLTFLSHPSTLALLTPKMKEYLIATIREVLDGAVEPGEWEAYVNLLGKVGGNVAEMYTKEAGKRGKDVDVGFSFLRARCGLEILTSGFV